MSKSSKTGDTELQLSRLQIFASGKKRDYANIFQKKTLITRDSYYLIGFVRL